jgi:hypothetical protein
LGALGVPVEKQKRKLSSLSPNVSGCSLQNNWRKKEQKKKKKKKKEKKTKNYST